MGKVKERFSVCVTFVVATLVIATQLNQQQHEDRLANIGSTTKPR
jgi:putative copper export protein